VEEIRTEILRLWGEAARKVYSPAAQAGKEEKGGNWGEERRVGQTTPGVSRARTAYFCWFLKKIRGVEKRKKCAEYAQRGGRGGRGIVFADVSARYRVTKQNEGRGRGGCNHRSSTQDSGERN